MNVGVALLDHAVIVQFSSSPVAVSQHCVKGGASALHIVNIDFELNQH